MTMTNNYIYYFCAVVIINIFITILSFFAPESPLYLYEKGKCEQARNLINRMAILNGSSLAHEVWLLDKEEIMGYSASGNLDLILDKNGNEIADDKKQMKLRNTLKPVGKQGLAFATSGDLSPPSKDNAMDIMRQHPQIMMNLIILTM
jgi:hypothetical protein